MQVHDPTPFGARLVELNFLFLPASVSIIRAVQSMVNITHEMNDVPQILFLRIDIGFFVF